MQSWSERTEMREENRCSENSKSSAAASCFSWRREWSEGRVGTLPLTRLVLFYGQVGVSGVMLARRRGGLVSGGGEGENDKKKS